MGGLFTQIANALPFVHAVQATRYALQCDYVRIMQDIVWAIGYAVVIFLLSIYGFMKKVNSDIK